MKKCLLLVSSLLILSKIIILAKEIELIPVPAEVAMQKGSFTLGSKASVSYSSSELKITALYLCEKLNLPTGFKIKAIQGTGGQIALKILDKPIHELGNEGYILEVNTSFIEIKANNPAGIFYGVQSLLQLFPAEIESKQILKSKWKVPAIKIKDYPRFAWRGLMLDVSRHFFSKEDVKSFIDQMVRYKFNTFHWHLTDDHGWRIEIKSLPKLTEIGAWRVERYGLFGSRNSPREGEKSKYGGFYTQDEIREIVQYAAERFVTIVPEIDIPGHSMAAIASYPELSCTKDSNIKVDPGTAYSEWYGNGTFKMNIDNTLNPSDEKVYDFLDKVFSEIAELFPGQYIHVGGDECYKGYWKQDSGCLALMKRLKIRHVEDLQGYFTGRVESILKTKGKKMLGWDEILEGGASQNAAVMCWRDKKIGFEAVANGHKVVMCPTAYSYLDYYQGEPTIEAPVYGGLRLSQSYKLEPAPADSIERNILGGQGNLWTENVPHLRYAQYMVWPRAFAISEIYWSKKENKNWENFISRVEAHFLKLDIAEINYSKAIYDPIINILLRDGFKWVDIQTEAPDLDVYFTIDGTMPDIKSDLYRGPFRLPEGQISLRVKSYRKNREVGNLVILQPQDIENRKK